MARVVGVARVVGTGEGRISEVRAGGAGKRSAGDVEGGVLESIPKEPRINSRTPEEVRSDIRGEPRTLKEVWSDPKGSLGALLAAAAGKVRDKRFPRVS
jgi:hypothetical protein